MDKYARSKPAASLSSSTYSSAASSSTSSTSSSSSTASDSSISSSSVFLASSAASSASSSSASVQSSASNSPSSQKDSHSLPTRVQPPPPPSSAVQQPAVAASAAKITGQDNGKLELALMEDLGKTAKIIEHHPCVLNTSSCQNKDTVPSSTTSKAEAESIGVAPAIVPTPAAPTTTTAATATVLSSYPPSAKNASYILDYTNGGAIANNPVSNIFASVNKQVNDIFENHQFISLTQNGTKKAATPSISSLFHNDQSPLSPNSSLTGNSWRTIGKRDKRKKKPVEKKILAQEIPGNIGDRSVEELASFIEPKTVKQNKGKTIFKNNQNGFTNHNSNNNTSTKTYSQSQQPKPTPNPVVKQTQQQSSTNQVPSQRPKNHNENNRNLQTPSVATQPQKLQPLKTDASQRDGQSSPSPKHKQSKQPQPQSIQSSPQQQPQSIHTTMSSPKTQRQLQQQPASPAAKDLKSEFSPRAKSKPAEQHMQQPSMKCQETLNVCSQTNANENSNHKQKQQPVVTFADHIRVSEDDVNQYTFGFFDDQTNHVNNAPSSIPLKNISHQNNCANHVMSNSNRGGNNTNYPNDNSNVFLKRHLTMNNQRPSSNEPRLQQNKTKQSRNNVKFREINKSKAENYSFNYEQILKFISSAWEASQTQISTAAAAVAQNH